MTQRLSSRAVWDGLFLPVGQGRGVYFANVGSGYVSLREDGDHRWRRYDSGKLPPAISTALGLAPPSAYELYPPDDSARWRESLVAAVAALRWAGLETLGLAAAPEYWRRAVWAEHGQAIVAACTKWGYEMPVRESNTVVFGAAESWETVLAPTDEGFAELLARVRQGRFTYSQLMDRCKSWWGREFPRGVADDRAIATLTDLVRGTQALRLENAPQSGFAVADVGDRRWQVGHLPSGQLLPIPFADLDAAKLAARWLGSVFGDREQVFLDEKQSALLTWLAEQSDLPTLSGLMAKYRADERGDNASGLM